MGLHSYRQPRLPGRGRGGKDWRPASGVPREAPRPGLCPFGRQPSRPRRESCCSTLRNAEPKRRREEVAGDYGDSRRGPRRGGARRTSPKCKQPTRQGKRRHPTPGPARSREVTTTRAAAGAARGCDGLSRAPAPRAAGERGAEAGPRTRQEPSPSSEGGREFWIFCSRSVSHAEGCLVNIVGAQETFWREEKRNWSSSRMASRMVLNVVARREIPRMIQFGSTGNGINRGCCRRLGFAPVTSGLTSSRDLTSLRLSLFYCYVE
ncbi:uncharacterized protein LOC132020155 [Mustela nigripes]|uniref:uncharacterized protein LOC132020155 n=1 Tax=Mustela nigripes TaxID=77151 RepID=UPI00281583A9|nr:uncharacterized protein LOC132020155 [Mustela nigripes]